MTGPHPPHVLEFGGQSSLSRCLTDSHYILHYSTLISTTTPATKREAVAYYHLWPWSYRCRFEEFPPYSFLVVWSAINNNMLPRSDELFWLRETIIGDRWDERVSF